jgi:hypothetical protein
VNAFNEFLHEIVLGGLTAGLMRGAFKRIELAASMRKRGQAKVAFCRAGGLPAFLSEKRGQGNDLPQQARRSGSGAVEPAAKNKADQRRP